MKYDLEILAARMEQLDDPLVGEQGLERIEALDGEGIDDGHPIIRRQLQKAQLGVVGLLAEELGVHRKHARTLGAAGERLERFLVGYVHPGGSLPSLRLFVIMLYHAY